MPTAIFDLPDIGRAPNAGDLIVVEKAGGGTVRLDFAQLKALLTLKKHIVTLSAGQTAIENIPNFTSGLFSAVVYGSEPLEETGELVVPPGSYRSDWANNSVVLGYEAIGGEKALIIYL